MRCPVSCPSSVYWKLRSQDNSRVFPISCKITPVINKSLFIAGYRFEKLSASLATERMCSSRPPRKAWWYCVAAGGGENTLQKDSSEKNTFNNFERYGSFTVLIICLSSFIISGTSLSVQGMNSHICTCVSGTGQISVIRICRMLLKVSTTPFIFTNASLLKLSHCWRVASHFRASRKPDLSASWRLRYGFFSRVSLTSFFRTRKTSSTGSPLFRLDIYVRGILY